MAHPNGHNLTTWSKGDQLSAESLNANFALIYSLAATALRQAQVPDAALLDVEMAQIRLAERVAGLEQLTALHAHQRNERQYVPLSDFGAVIVLVNDLRRDVENAIGRANQIHAAHGVSLDDLENRLCRIEQQPEPADKEAFAAVAHDHERLAVDHDRLLAEVIELRHEVSILRDLALGTDRLANRMEYAPLALVGQILQRLDALEAK